MTIHSSIGDAIMMMRSNVIVFVCLFSSSVMVYLYLYFSSEISRLSTSNAQLEMRLNHVNRQLSKISKTASNSNGKYEAANGIFDDSIIIYNRVPKTASTSFVGIAYNLCRKNGFNVLHLNTTKNAHTMSLSDQRRFISNITLWNDKKPALYHGHLAFIDFNRFGVPSQPIYINIIRQPLDRLVSYYYFLRYGDDYRPHLKRSRKGNTQTFDECVENGGRDCDPVAMWMQVPFFCGHAAECQEPGSRWAVEQAKHNLIHNYLLVGVTEELEEFIAMLEYTLPQYFAGAMELFLNGDKSHLRKTSKKLDPSMETVKKIQSSRVWKMESEFYEFTLKHFRMLRTQMLKRSESGELIDGGQKFRFEKIRPKK